MRYLRRLLKLLNPFIFLWNFFKYECHMESFSHGASYERYDFANRNTKYF